MSEITATRIAIKTHFDGSVMGLSFIRHSALFAVVVALLVAELLVLVMTPRSGLITPLPTAAPSPTAPAATVPPAPTATLPPNAEATTPPAATNLAPVTLTARPEVRVVTPAPAAAAAPAPTPAPAATTSGSG